jgi:hypothetical protein
VIHTEVLPMARLGLVLLVCLASACTSRGRSPALPRPGVWPGPGPAPAVTFLGTAHGFHLKAAFGYSLSDVTDQIRAAQPDLVCAEITPEDHGSEREAMYPWEVAVVEEAARTLGATFVAADWRPAWASQEVMTLDAEMTPEERRRFEGVYREFMPRFQAAFGPRVFDFLHADATQALVRRIHEAMIDAGTEVAAGFWDTRNQVIAKRCLRQALRRGSRRVLIVFGAEHRYGVESALLRFYGIRARPIGRRVAHANHPVGTAVLERWERARAGLARLLEGGTLPPRIAEQWRRGKSVDRLKAAIETGGIATHR